MNALSSGLPLTSMSRYFRSRQVVAVERVHVVHERLHDVAEARAVHFLTPAGCAITRSIRSKIRDTMGRNCRIAATATDNRHSRWSMSFVQGVRRVLGKVEVDVGLGGPSIRVSLAEVFSPEGIDDRIAKLDAIQKDLAAAVTAVGELKNQAVERKDELQTLQDQVKQLQEDRAAAEQMLNQPEDAVIRLYSRAAGRNRVRGIVEGLVIGFVTGAASSLLIWYVTK